MSSNVNNNNNELDNNIDDAIYYAKLINFEKKSNQFYQQQQLNNKSINKKMNIYEDITDLTNSDLVVNSTNQQQQQPQRSLKTKRLALNQQQNNKQNQMIINQIYKDNLNNILNKQQQQQQQLKANNNEQLLFKLIKTNSSTSTSPCSTSTSSTSSTSSTTSSKITKKSTTTNSSLSNSQSSTLLVKKKPYTQPDLNTYLQYSLITTQIPKQHKSSDESNDEDSQSQTIQKNFDLLVLKPSNTNNNNNSNKLAQNSNLHDSTLLTPLHHNIAPKTLNKKISIDSISSPTPVPFDSFNYFNKLNKNSNSPAEHNQQQINSVKSASTSYLLSKISSLANLTLPKNRPSITPTSTANSSSSSSSSAQQSPIMNQQGLMNNLANKTTKFFNRKLSQQTLELSTTPLSSNSYLILSSSSVNSIDQETQSPSLTMDYLDENNLDDVCCDEEVNCLIGQQNLDYNDCASSSKIGYKTVQRIKNLKSASSSSSSTKSSISSSTNHVNVTTTTATTSSRRPFKKRSQSIHANLDNKIWFYNPAEECWYMTGPLSSLSKSDTAKQQLASSSSSSYSSSNSFLDNLDSNHVKKIKLNDIQIKYLTLIELKYLKQICFNKSQKYFEQAYAQQRDSTNSQQSKTFCIPKDESMKTIKTKNIQSMTTRSRSVDFKFFEDIKENYFFKKSQKDNAELVFGQTLYKCILNDLKKSSSTSRMNSSKPKQSLPLSVNKKWKSNNSNLIIASKFDLNILNGINPNPNPKQNMDSFYSKRNSVLFEALDLKNTNFNKVISNNPPNNQKTSEPTQNSVQFNTNNQNLSIRSEGLVPNIVKSCCKHISEYGLDVVGIFRIDSSKKRIKELKEMYDSGKDVVLGESFNTNDAACLLKEYLRSLPEPLLTRDLYSSFLATNKITDQNLRLEIVRNLICLLPVPNRDTLEVLLKLLDKIRSYAEPINENDKIIGGNKMDAFNLAMVFGPNLLKKHKLSQISLNSKANDIINDKYNIIDDIDSVISVTKYLIENQDLIFSIDSALHNELIQTINNITPSEVELIMNRKIVSSIGVSILDPNPSGLLSENNSELANTYSTSNNAPQKPSPSEESSTSGSYCSSTNELDKLIQSNSLNSLSHNNFTENVDFIDNGTSTRNRTSRTKLHRISNNLAYQNETICFVNSPSHSPRPVINKPKRISEPYKYGENLNENFYQNKPVMQNQGSLLLMIQSNQGNNQKPKLRQTDSISKENKSERLIMSKSIRSLSNLNLENNPELNSDTQTYRINLNSSKLCSKFFDKSKFNTIGEQETLV